MKKEEKMFYIKIRNMYLYDIVVSTEYPANDFIETVEFRANNCCANIYTKEIAEKIREKLHDIGFEMDKTYLEEVIEKDTDK